MTIWILALLLFVLLAAIGYNRGAIRVSFSLIGLFTASWLAVPLSKMTTPLVRSLLSMFSNPNPLLVAALAPVAAFIMVLTLVKLAGLATHKKIEVHFKYKAGDLRLALWERMNKRIGACLGVANGLVYTVLIALACYVVSYGTTQMELDASAPKLTRLVTRMGQDVVSTGLVKVVRAIDPTPKLYYEAADTVGLIYHNPLIQSRLCRYPVFLSLTERSEFQELTNDTEYYEMLARQAPVAEIIRHPKTQAILNNPALLREIWTLVSTNLSDINHYLATGESTNYSEAILGYWTFDLGASANELKRTQPKMTTTQHKELRKYLMAAFNKTTLLATLEHQIYMKDYCPIAPGTVVTPELVNQFEKKTGTWDNSGGKYTVAISGLKEMTGKIENGKLRLQGGWSPLVFAREN